MKYQGSVGHSGCFKKEALRIFELLKTAIQIPLLIDLKINDPAFPPLVEVLPSERCVEASGLPSTITLYTSGTTGTPKAMSKEIVPLFKNKKGSGDSSHIWLLTYEPWRWAGVSVMLHVLKHNSRLIIPNSTSPEDLFVTLPEVTHLSLTPSLFKKMVIVFGDFKIKNIQQITFGGEYATQGVLNLAKNCFPCARVGHVYASTETGDICASTDGLEGYPIEKMRNCSINECGVLTVDGIATGDTWKIENGRYIYTGRVGDTIKVGGTRVSLHEVEAMAETHCKVMQAQCYAIKSPLLGEAVAINYVGQVDKASLRDFLRSKLPRSYVPIKYNQVSNIEVSSTGKKKR